MKGGLYLYPLARCAVPFFFIVAGYFCSSKDSSSLEEPLKKNIKKWFFLWLKFTVVFFVIVTASNLYLGNILYTSHDLQTFLKEGSAPFCDMISFAGKTYGISVIWFLYSGTLAFIILYITRKLLFKPLFAVSVFLFFLLAIFVNYETVKIPRFLYLGLPFIYIGVLLRNHNSFIFKNLKLIIPFAIFSLAACYAEFFYVIKTLGFHNVQCYWLTPFLSVSLFSLLLCLGDKFTIGVKLPTVLTLDVYIWHRFVFFIFAVTGMNNFFWGFDAIVVFVSCIAVAFIMRKTINFRKKA